MKPKHAVLLLALALAASSCGMLRDRATYRRLVAHERETAGIEITRYDLRVDAWEGVVHVIARVTLQNGTAEPLERVRFYLHADADPFPRDEARRELEHETRIERLGDLAVQSVEVRGFDPIASGEARTISFDYSIEVDEADETLRLGAEDGYLLRESLWVPVLHTPLAEGGMDRAPTTLEVELAAPLVPVTWFELEPVGEPVADGEDRTWRGASDFPYAPFLAWGPYVRSGTRDATAAVYELAPHSLESTSFVLGALRDLLEHYEAAFGPAGLGIPRLAVVRRGGASWGAPCCILMDEALWPRTRAMEYGAFELVAHELAHTWWGGRVDQHGRGGYLHEGLANWCAADAVGLRGGAEATERAYEVWLIRYARGAQPLGVPLREISVLDGERWERGAYLVGAHFWRALERELGRDAFVELLRAFADEHALPRGDGAADLDDLRALVGRLHGTRCDDLFRRWLDRDDAGDELFDEGRALIERRTAAWRARTPDPDPALVARVADVLERGSERVAAVDLAALEPAARGALLDDLNAMPELQVTVLDRAGGAVHHADGLTGDLRGHRDVRGDAVYASILAADAQEGTLANFDFVSVDLLRARENALAWRRVGDLTIVVEGHAWRTLE